MNFFKTDYIDCKVICYGFSFDSAIVNFECLWPIKGGSTAIFQKNRVQKKFIKSCCGVAAEPRALCK